ncbi:cytochrome c oxidase subunit III domain-containing protein [Phlyctochytrium arcticum]|nr:cytochrome c oxidase subunit III domain-containing protein [Phlyctochytrium arcticum]
MFWWRDVIREAFGGFHTTVVQKASEIMLFASFFWAMFHSSLSPTVELGATWPPIGIHAVNPWGIPLLGSCVLLASGFVLTIGHHALVEGNKDLTIASLVFTVLLGAFFLFLQYTEYFYGEFTIADSVFGSVFYCTTGLHAIHVIIGVLFLTLCLIRTITDAYTIEHHVSFLFAVYYWHLNGMLPMLN